MLKDFPLITRFSVPFADIDMMQHVNNVAYIRWLETMRAEYFAQVMGGNINGATGMIQASINFTYERQLAYREDVAVGIKISRIGTKSWDFYYEVWSATHEKRAAHGITGMVAFDFVSNRTIAVPQAWRDAIAAYENGPQRIYT
ncbi:MAG: acyl-CoA thioesterase [Candidatus Eremiobacteraeota bacterium]|nr:acyl-CoA thioesterase [Candidatus Eremiobacteraeota bacterium]